MALHQQQVTFHGQAYPHYYLCHYRPRWWGRDNLSRSLIRLKEGSSVDREAWYTCTLAAFHKLNLPKGSLVLRALGSHEKLITSETALDHIGEGIARLTDSFYMPHLLSKIRYTRPMKVLTKHEREKELDGCYVLAKPPSGLNIRDVLLLDDILTSGSTMLKLTDVVKKQLPDARIHLYTLAYTPYRADLPLPGLQRVRTNADQFSEPETMYTPAVEKLKRMIDEDAFDTNPNLIEQRKSEKKSRRRKTNSK